MAALMLTEGSKHSALKVPGEECEKEVACVAVCGPPWLQEKVALCRDWADLGWVSQCGRRKDNVAAAVLVEVLVVVVVDDVVEVVLFGHERVSQSRGSVAIAVATYTLTTLIYTTNNLLPTCLRLWPPFSPAPPLYPTRPLCPDSLHRAHTICAPQGEKQAKPVPGQV